LLRDISGLLKRSDKFFVLFDRQSAGRHTTESIARMDLSAARHGIKSNAICRAANYGRAR
jgi:hypothetical protein